MKPSDDRLPDRVEFDPETEQYRYEWNPERGKPVSQAVVTTVAAIRDRDVTDLAPLNRTVDPDALNSLFGSTDAGRSRSTRRLSFVYEDHEVTIRRGGELVVRPQDRDERNATSGDGASPDA